METLEKVKLFLRKKNAAFDSEILDNIAACLSELQDSRVLPDETDPQVLSAIKLYCKARDVSDPDESAKWMAAYEKLRLNLSGSMAHREDGCCNG